MSRESLGLNETVQNYLLSVGVREPRILAELRELTAQRSDAGMQIAAEQGQFMGLLVKLCQARAILEIGTFTGYSSLVMALALPEDGKVTTLDINEKTATIARRYWDKAGVSSKIEQHLGPARQTLDSLRGPFDLVFIDADKTNYDYYYEAALGLLRSGGLILLDNVLWNGQVAYPEVQDPDTVALRLLNSKIHADERVEIAMVPVGDGLTLARKK